MWLSAVEASQIPELRRFAQGLLKDKSAVVAGLTLSYSNGPVEAQVHKRETWSSVPCLAAPSCLYYGNACFMQPDLDRYLLQPKTQATNGYLLLETQFHSLGVAPESGRECGKGVHQE
jgi:hypothetical protein